MPLESLPTFFCTCAIRRVRGTSVVFAHPLPEQAFVTSRRSLHTHSSQRIVMQFTGTFCQRTTAAHDLVKFIKDAFYLQKMSNRFCCITLNILYHIKMILAPKIYFYFLTKNGYIIVCEIYITPSLGLQKS